MSKTKIVRLERTEFTLDNEGKKVYEKAMLDALREKRKALVDLYLDECITKEAFKEKAQSMDREIERQEETIGVFCKYKFEKKDLRTVVDECLKYAEEFIGSSEASDEFIKAILEEMVIYKNKVIEVKLKLIPEKWMFAMESAKKLKNQEKTDDFSTCVSDVPTSDTGYVQRKKVKKPVKNTKMEHSKNDIPMYIFGQAKKERHLVFVRFVRSASFFIAPCFFLDKVYKLYYIYLCTFLIKS